MARFTSETARLAGQKSKRGRAHRDPIVHDAMEILLTEGMAKLYEKMDELNSSQQASFRYKKTRLFTARFFI
jgi:hypothetical protein